ncbi:uncharacterized protein EHS24_008693 [Apiotrichum porosum]|uniref:Uncharacterized protein n=1 Tax=Apiotrichum porosum TaxID=105984 RepID=A0A427XQY6_9TREE|nr:uncharacterized protein EHS24_008693 [Apiotrichum porosum]RSH81254.1 hypothetical protein EHS24_008693 [Apiotrichum porosum]
MDPLHTRIMESMGATVMLFRVVVWHPNAHLRALLDWAYGVEELLGMFTQQKLTKPTLAQERKAVREYSASVSTTRPFKDAAGNRKSVFTKEERQQGAKIIFASYTTIRALVKDIMAVKGIIVTRDFLPDIVLHRLLHLSATLGFEGVLAVWPCARQHNFGSSVLEGFSSLATWVCARNLGYLNANPEAGLTRRTADQSGPERHPEGAGSLPDWDVFVMLKDWMLEALMSKCLEKGQIPFPWNPLFGDPFPMAQQQSIMDAEALDLAFDQVLAALPGYPDPKLARLTRKEALDLLNVSPYFVTRYISTEMEQPGAVLVNLIMQQVRRNTGRGYGYPSTYYPKVVAFFEHNRTGRRSPHAESHEPATLEQKMELWELFHQGDDKLPSPADLALKYPGATMSSLVDAAVSSSRPGASHIDAGGDEEGACGQGADEPEARDAK